MDLSVLLPTRNRAKILGPCIDALLAQDPCPGTYEVVVIDNGSSDRTSEMVSARATTDDRLRLVTAPVTGLNRARNAGIAATVAPVVAFIDDDEVVPPDYVARLFAALDQHPSAAGVGGPYREVGSVGRVCDRCSLGTVSAPADTDGRANRLLGGNMVLRRTAFEAVGLFDEDLSGRGDEAEWFHRAARAGLWFQYDNDLVVGHRRDVFSPRQILWTQFRQGWALPLAHTRMARPFRPKPKRILGGIGHGLRRRCLHGFVLAMREMGALLSAVRHPRTLRIKAL